MMNVSTVIRKAIMLIIVLRKRTPLIPLALLAAGVEEEAKEEEEDEEEIESDGSQNMNYTVVTYVMKMATLLIDVQ